MIITFIINKARRIIFLLVLTHRICTINSPDDSNRSIFMELKKMKHYIQQQRIATTLKEDVTRNSLYVKP